MRPSPLSHPLAVFRSFVKIGQKELAELAKCSRPTIQAIELGKLKLSDGLAVRISAQTALSVQWLLKGDPTAPMVDTLGKPYTIQTWEKTQANLLVKPSDDSAPVVEGKELTPWLFGVDVAFLWELYRSTPPGVPALISYKVKNLLCELMAEYQIRAPYMARDNQVHWERHEEILKVLQYADEWPSPSAVFSEHTFPGLPSQRNDELTHEQPKQPRKGKGRKKQAS